MAVADAFGRHTDPSQSKTKYPLNNYRTASDLVREIAYYSYSGTKRFYTCEQCSGLATAIRKKGGKKESLQEIQIKSLSTTSEASLQTR